LKEAGFLVELAGDGEISLERIKEKKPDLMLLDLVLPHIDGWEVLKRIRADEALRAVPVVIFSNLSQKSDIDKGISLGATKYLIKAQYTPSEVVEEIKKILG
ncbi:MAG: response regulator, partial [bacterium]|nr:response regulator [bacterium]